MGAVSQKALVYFDTNPLMYAFEGSSAHSGRLQKLLAQLRSFEGAAVTSELTLAELLAPVARPGALPQPVRRRIYFDLLIWSKFFDLRPISRDVLLETTRLREVAKYKLPDAIHVVTAVQAGCRFVVSNDRDLGRLPNGIVSLLPDESGVATILTALGA